MSNAKILIVEDERIVAEDIKKTLQNLGYAVCSIVTSGAEAVKKAEQDSPDLILMDIVLQDEMSGIEAAEQIRTRFNIPVIYLTAYADVKTLERAKITEPFGYIIKPFDERELHSTIEMALYKNQTERELEESKSRLENIINNNADGIIIVDHKGIVRFTNPAAEIIFSRKKEELVGELFGFPLVSNETTELDIIGKDGKSGIVEMRIAKIKWEGETAYLSSLRDITEHKQIEHDLQMSFEKSQRILEETVNSLASAFGKRDLYTAGHQQRVTKLAIAIAKEMGLSKERIQGIRIAGLIHDIGKISVPAEILTKPSKLTTAEFEIVKEHPKIAYDIVRSIEFPWPVAEIIYQHHERLNGSGYPRGLKDGEILQETKILIVADVVEAMSSHRPYRPARGMKITLEEIAKNRGILYDPQATDVCLMLIKEKGFKFDGYPILL
jgi:putative nucleotidyltransferase with HDIG domain